MTPIRKKIIASLTPALQEKILTEVKEGKEPRQVMRDLNFFLQDFDKEMMKITYNYVKFLESICQNDKDTSVAFEQFLNKMDYRYDHPVTRDGETKTDTTLIDNTTTFFASDLDTRENDRQKYDEMMSKLQHTQVRVVGEKVKKVNPTGEVEETGLTIADLLDKEQKIVQALTDLSDSIHIRNLYNDNMEETFSGLLKTILTSVNELSEKYTTLAQQVDELSGQLTDLEIKTLDSVAKMLNKVKVDQTSPIISNNLEIDNNQELVTFKHPGTTSDLDGVTQAEVSDELTMIEEVFAIGEEVFYQEEVWTIIQASQIKNSVTDEEEIRIKIKNNLTQEELWVGLEEIDK